jgi:hypothetical protein
MRWWDYLEPRIARSQSCDSAASTNAFPGSPLSFREKSSQSQTLTCKNTTSLDMRMQHLVSTVIDGTLASLHIAENLFRIIHPAAILATSRSLLGELKGASFDEVIAPFEGESGAHSSDSCLLHEMDCFFTRLSSGLLHNMMHAIRKKGAIRPWGKIWLPVLVRILPF